MTDLKTKIMRRVYGIWFVKKVLPYLVTEAAVFAGFLYLIGQNVYFAMVIKYAAGILTANATNPIAWLTFAAGIFIHTRLIVQFLALGSLLMIVLVFKNLISSAVQLAFARETKIGNASF